MKIPYGKQHITQQDIDAVVQVLKSDYLTQGPEIQKFEKAFSKYVGAKYAIAVANGTAALHLSVLALGLSENDKVITTPITFAASANCIRYCGAEVDFVDIDPHTYLMDLNKLEKKLAKAPLGTYKGIISVDFAGYAVDLERLERIAKMYNLWIIEDACHAPGGYFIDSNGNQQLCGNGRFAELAVFSFHPVKHITTGEGGMITTNNKKLYERLLSLRTHGITKRPELLIENHGGWYYEMQDLGFNYRLTDIQAALGHSQLKEVNLSLLKRRKIAEVYNAAFKGKPFIKGQSGVIEGHAYHLYIVEVENRKGLYEHLHEHNILCQVHYIPVHLMPYYKHVGGWEKGDMPLSETYYQHCLSLPMYSTLTEKEQNFVIKKISEFYK